jgi:hypothetical protein
MDWFCKFFGIFGGLWITDCFGSATPKFILSVIIGQHRWYIVCSRWIYHLPQIHLSKNHLDRNYLPRKISTLHFYDNRQKTNFFQFITPNLEFIYSFKVWYFNPVYLVCLFLIGFSWLLLYRIRWFNLLIN